jgi:serine/threonine-protein kinase
MTATSTAVMVAKALALWDQVDARSDVYSLGASMFTLLTGQLVHDGRTVAELMVHISTKPARPIRSVLELVPAPLASVIDRALLPSREQRFDDAGAMLAALRQAGVDMLAQRHGRSTLVSGGDAFDGDATIRAEPGSVLPMSAQAVSVPFAPTGTLHAGRAPVRDTARPVSSDPRRVPKAGLGVLFGALALLGGLGGYVAYRSTTKPAAPADPVTSTAAISEEPSHATTERSTQVLPSSPAVSSTPVATIASAVPPPTIEPASTSARPSAAPVRISRPTSKPSAKPDVSHARPTSRPCVRDPMTMLCKP